MNSCAKIAWNGNSYRKLHVYIIVNYYYISYKLAMWSEEPLITRTCVFWKGYILIIWTRNKNTISSHCMGSFPRYRWSYKHKVFPFTCAKKFKWEKNYIYINNNIHNNYELFFSNKTLSEYTNCYFQNV